MDSFLRHTAVSILDTIDWKQLSRTTLVLPSHRAGLVLKEEILRLQQERHAQAIWAPTVQTLPQLQDALSPLYAEEELLTIVRLYKIYRSTFQSPMSLDLFYGWGRQMLADFTNIDASMHASEVPNFFANTVAARELEQWHLDPETEERLRKLVNPVSSIQSQIAKESVKSHYEERQRAVITRWDDDHV